MIEKYLSAHWQVRTTFDEPMKIASGYSPESYIHPEVVKFAEEIEPDPRCCYAHVIAMSDGNHYGTNMNGDWFDADELTGLQSPAEAGKNSGEKEGKQLPRYKTFEDAKFFRHHDNTNRSPFYGDVPLAVWNDVMKRVELIIRIFRQIMPEVAGSSAAPEVAMKIDNGGYLTVSMGCRIHHETCMYCGHENEFISQRCDHLRRHMNEIMPDGKIAGAKNYGMRFFDISDVTIPADPIAFSMGKVAEFDPTFLPPLTKNAAVDFMQEVIHKIAWRRKWAEMDKQVGGNGTTLSDIPIDSCPQVPMEHESPVEFDASELKQLIDDCGGDVDTAVSTLASVGVVLSPTELAQLSAATAPHNASFDDPNFPAPSGLSLDKFSHAAYHSLQSKIAERSGFLVPCPVSGWEPVKLAEMGGAAAEMADYYAYYRTLLRSLPIEGFIKSAYGNSAIRELLGNSVDHSRVKAAMHYLAYAGLTTASVVLSVDPFAQNA